MNRLSKIDREWAGKRIRVKEGHPRANETAIFSHSANTNFGFGLVFISDNGKAELFFCSSDLKFLEVLK